MNPGPSVHDRPSPPSYGAQSMVAPLIDVLVRAPDAAFGAAFDDPRHGFLHAVDLEVARREHAGLVDRLVALGVRVNELADGVPEDAIAALGGPDPDLVYVFDPLLVTDRGAIPLRPGKPNRRGEPAVLEAWTAGQGIPTLGRIDGPATVEGGDTFWLRPDLLCVGRSLRTNDAGAQALARLVGGDVRVFDLPYWRGPEDLVHLLSVISPVADDLAVVFPPLLPAGLHELLADLRVRWIEVPEAELATLGCNVLAVRPGVVIVADGNPVTRRRLEAAGCEVHAVPLRELGMNGSGGVTCLTRPIRRAT